MGLGIFLLVLWLLFFVYLPLGARLRRAGKELSRLQSELHAARDTVASAKEIPFYLPEQKKISSLIEELTQLGKELGVDFRSIRPQQIEETPLGYRLLPVEMKLESSYKELGLFMGSLRKLKSGAITVANFQIDRDEDVFPNLNCRLFIKIALRP